MSSMAAGCAIQWSKRVGCQKLQKICPYPQSLRIKKYSLSKQIFRQIDLPPGGGLDYKNRKLCFHALIF